MVLNGIERDTQKIFLFGVFVTTAVILLPALTGRLGWLQSFAPLPVFYYSVLLGDQQGRRLIAVSAIVAGLIAAATGTLQILFFSYLLLPLGFLLAHESRKKDSVNSAALKGIALVVAVWVLFGIIYAVATKSNPYMDLLANLDQDLTATFRTIKNQYTELPLDTKRELESTFASLRLLVPRILPALLAIMVLGTVLQNLVLGHVLLKRNNQGFTLWGKLQDWRLPEWLIWGAIFAGICMIIPVNALNVFGLNLLLVFGTFYFLQGLAVFSGYLTKWSVPPAVRVIIYIMLLLLQVYSILIITVLGVTDIWTELRKVEKN